MEINEILSNAEKTLNKCETDFEEFYKASMGCYGVYYYTKAIINMYGPTIECIKQHEKAKELIKKFNQNYK